MKFVNSFHNSFIYSLFLYIQGYPGENGRPGEEVRSFSCFKWCQNFRGFTILGIFRNSKQRGSFCLPKEFIRPLFGNLNTLIYLKIDIIKSSKALRR